MYLNVLFCHCVIVSIIAIIFAYYICIAQIIKFLIYGSLNVDPHTVVLLL